MEVREYEFKPRLAQRNRVGQWNRSKKKTQKSNESTSDTATVSGKRKRLESPNTPQNLSVENTLQQSKKRTCPKAEGQVNTSIKKSLASLKNDIVMDSLCASFKKREALVIRGATLPQTHRANVVSRLYRSALGLGWKPSIEQQPSPVGSIVSQMQRFRMAVPFDRRCTAVEWHPTNPYVVAVGSKGGDIILWNTKKTDHDLFIQGMGPGGSVQALKFADDDYSQVYTASIDGTVARQDFYGKHKIVLLDTLSCVEGPGGNVSGIKFHPDDLSRIYTSALDGKVGLQDFHGKNSQVFLDTMTWDFWYCSLDINPKRHLLVTGDNVGNVTMLSMDGKSQQMKQRLHKSKVTHCEFSPREDWLLCTASVDQTAKLWDVRMIKDKHSALATLQHAKPINSAYFNPMDGMRLLTTDQNHEVRVYRAPDFYLEHTIEHPHRHFQHLTPIKAAWHPLEDLIVVGRYPDPKYPESPDIDRRTVDVYSADTGALVCQLNDPMSNGIISLNKFNSQGDRLISTMGLNIIVWARHEEIVKEQEKLLNQMKMLSANGAAGEPGGPSTGSRGSGRASGGSNRRQGGGDAKEKDKKSQNSKTNTQTKDSKLKTKTTQSSRKKP